MDDAKFLDDVIARQEKGQGVDFQEMHEVCRKARERILEYQARVTSLDAINQDCFRRLASHVHAWEMLKIITLYSDDEEALKQVYDLLKMRLGIP